MKTIMGAVAVLGVVGTATAAEQPQWNKSEGDGGAIEFRLRNSEGAAILVGCHLDGVYAGFEFPEPLDNPERATVRGVPGHRHNVAVSQVSDRVLRVSSGQGINDTFQLLRDSSRLHVRVAGQQATFNIFGSDSVITECLERQEDRIQNPSTGNWPTPTS